MSIYIPTQPGGTISASDSDSISTELSPEGLPLGTKVWNADVGNFFKLTASTASLVADQVLAVLGIVGARWIVDGPNFTTANQSKLDTVLYIPKVAALLTDADATVQPYSTKSGLYVLPSNMLTTDRGLTLGVTGMASPTIVVRIAVMPQTHGFVIKNSVGGTLFTYTAGEAATLYTFVNTGGGEFLASSREYIEVTA